jgi:hypothetical protein
MVSTDMLFAGAPYQCANVENKWLNLSIIRIISHGKNLTGPGLNFAGTGPGLNFAGTGPGLNFAGTGLPDL